MRCSICIKECSSCGRDAELGIAFFAQSFVTICYGLSAWVAALGFGFVYPWWAFVAAALVIVSFVKEVRE